MDIPLFKKLLDEQLISRDEFANIERRQDEPVSVYWDITSLLYIGILLFAGGLGILIYKNPDTIGHTAIVTIVGVTCTGCFLYCFKKSKGYSSVKVESPNILIDYVLLLGCLLLLAFIGYLQFQYNIFGNDWGMATFIPMILSFLAAYYFDHLGVLSMAITSLAAWAGFTVAPLHIVRDNDFRNDQIIYTGLLLGIGLIAISLVSNRRKIKAHFAFTYKNFGAHILFVSLLAALFHFKSVYLFWFVLLITAAVLFFKDAIKEGSFYFLIVTLLYSYIGISYVVVNLLSDMQGDSILYLGFIYFITSGITLMRILVHYNKKLKKDAHI